MAEDEVTTTADEGAVDEGGAPEGAKPPTAGQRYGRGGYRRSAGRYTDARAVPGEEVRREEPKPINLDGNILDGATIGARDPTAVPNAGSDVGGPPTIDLEKGGLGVPEIGQAMDPAVSGDRQRELDELEVEIADDRELTPEVDESEELDLVEQPGEEPPPNPIAVTDRTDDLPPNPIAVTARKDVSTDDETKDLDAVNVREPQVAPPEDLVSDGAMTATLAEEPAEEEQARGEGLTRGQLDAEAGVTPEAGSEESPSVTVDAEGGSDDDIEISESGEDKPEGAGETF